MTKSPKKIANYIYIIIIFGILIAFLILEWVRVYKMKDWNLISSVLLHHPMPTELMQFGYDVVRDLAIALVPVAIILFSWEFALKETRYEEILDIFDRRNRQSKKITDAGLLDIMSSISDDYLVDFIDQAKFEIRILAPWFMDPYILERIFKAKVKKSYFKLQIIFLRPGSPFAQRRGEVLQPAYPDYANAKLKESLLSLSNALKGTKSKHIEILTYNSLPSLFIIQVDGEEALLGLYLHTDVAMKNPCLKIKTNIDGRETLLGRMARKEFDQVLKLCSKIKLSSINVNDEDKLIYTEEPYRSQVIYHAHSGNGKDQEISWEEMLTESAGSHPSKD